MAHFASVSDLSLSNEEVTVSCYENEVPAFVEAALERLYGCIFSSLAQFRIYGGIENASTYVARANGELVAVLLFHRKGRRIRVVNEGIALDAKEIARFVEHVFAAYAGVDAVVFHAVQADTHGLPFPYQRFNCTEDSVVTLPRTAGEYLASLGQSTRKNIKRHLNRLQRDFPSFSFLVYEKDDIDEMHVREITRLNHLRMAGKNKVSFIDEEEMQRLLRLAKECGLVGVIMIDGKVCAGGIVYRFDNNYFSLVKVHDPDYNDYSLGMVGNYLIICACLERGGKEFHLMWGREEHKSLLRGVQRDFDHVVVYRSRLHLLSNADIAFKTVFNGYTRRAKMWLLHEARHERNLLSKLAVMVLNRIRNMRRSEPGSKIA